MTTPERLVLEASGQQAARVTPPPAPPSCPSTMHRQPSGRSTRPIASAAASDRRGPARPKNTAGACPRLPPAANPVARRRDRRWADGDARRAEGTRISQGAFRQ